MAIVGDVSNETSEFSNNKETTFGISHKYERNASAQSAEYRTHYIGYKQPLCTLCQCLRTTLGDSVEIATDKKEERNMERKDNLADFFSAQMPSDDAQHANAFGNVEAA